MAHFDNEWHLRDADAIASQLDTDIYRGLDGKVAERRRRKNGKNNIWHIRRLSIGEYFSDGIVDLTFVVLLIVALTAALFGRDTAAYTTSALLIVGTFVRIFAFISARRTLEELALYGIPNSTVIRNGIAKVVRADEIVIGDIVIVEAGDSVPCDGRIVTKEEVRVSEKGITDNKTSVIKRDTVILTEDRSVSIPCEYRVNMLFAGSSVLSGSCRMIATACGENTLVSMRRGGLVISSGENIKIVNELEEFCRRGRMLMLAVVMAITCLVIGIDILRTNSFSLDEAFIDALALAAASAYGTLSVLSVAMISVPLKKAARGDNGRSVIKNANDIDKIASVKTLIATDTTLFKSGVAGFRDYYANDSICRISKDDVVGIDLLSKIMTTVGCRDNSSAISSDDRSVGDREVIIGKMRDYINKKLGVEVKVKSEGEALVVDHSVTPSVNGETDNAIILTPSGYEIHACGDIREILSYCSSYVRRGKVRSLSEETKVEILRAAAKYECRGATVIAHAHKDSVYTSLKRLSYLKSNMCFDGFVVAEEESAIGLNDALAYSRDRFDIVLLSSRSVIDRGFLVKIGACTDDTPILSCKDVLSDCELPKGGFIVAVPARSENRRKIDANAKLRLATVKKLTDKLPGCAVLTGEPSEAGMMAENVVGSAVSKASFRPIPQTLKRKAELAVYPTEKAGYGGFVGTVSGISAAIRAVVNLRRAVHYCMMSQAMRIVCTLLSILFGISALNAPSILLLGLVFDFAAVGVIAFSQPNTDKNAEIGLPKKKQILTSFGKGAIVGFVSFIIIYVVTLLLPNDLPSSSIGMTASLILAQMVLLSENLLGGHRVFKRGYVNYAYVLYGVLTLVVVLLMNFSSAFCTFMGGALPSWIMSTVYTVGVIPVFIVCELLKLRKD